MKKYKGAACIFSLKSKGVYNLKFKPLSTASLHSIKLSGYRIGKKIDKHPLGVEKHQLLEKNCKCLHCV